MTSCLRLPAQLPAPRLQRTKGDVGSSVRLLLLLLERHPARGSATVALLVGKKCGIHSRRSLILGWDLSKELSKRRDYGSLRRLTEKCGATGS